MTEILMILLAALLPVVVVLWFINHKDSKKPEPTGQLVRAFLWGIATIPLSYIISLPFDYAGLCPQDDSTIPNALKDAFFAAAIPEEAAKLIILWVVLRKNTYFDEHLDGIVYAVCVGMGFASVENLMYLFDESDWLSVGIMRALSSIPGHMFFAVIMGYYYSLAHFSTNSKTQHYMLMALLMPILAHGVYDSLLMMLDAIGDWAFLLVIAFIVFLYKLYKRCMKRIEEMRVKE